MVQLHKQQLHNSAISHILLLIQVTSMETFFPTVSANRQPLLKLIKSQWLPTRHSAIHFPPSSFRHQTNRLRARDSKALEEVNGDPKDEEILTVKCQKERNSEQPLQKSVAWDAGLNIRRMSLAIFQRAKREIVRQMTRPPQWHH